MIHGDSTGKSDRKFALPRAFILIFAIYLLGIVSFGLFRVFFLANYSQFVSGVSWSQIVTSFIIGWRFDQIIVLVILAPLVLTLPWVNLRNRLLRIALMFYLTVLFSASFFLLFADVRFYSVFDAHLNFLVYENMFNGPFVKDLVLADPMFWLYTLIWVAVTGLFAVTLRNLIKKFAVVRLTLPWWNRLGYFLLFLILFAAGIRGRFGLAPMDWGVAYFSHNRFLNQLALNGVYTLGRNIWERDNDPRLSNMPESQRFPFVPAGEALKTVQSMLHEDNDVWLQPDSNLSRRTSQPPSNFGFKPNIVLVIMETWEGITTGALGDSRNLTPNFDTLAAHGILFTNFYASGTRTAYGLAATIGSFPAIPGRPILKRYNAHHPFVTLSEILHHRGYTNAFAYGGDFAFDNIEGFFREHKYDRFYGEDYFPFTERFSKWGIPDRILLDHVAGLIDSIPRPFQFTVLTLSNHEPYDLPDSSVRRYMDRADSSKIFNSQLYADYALGTFFNEMRKRPVTDSTIFLFVSDHGHYSNSPYPIEQKYFHIPFLIYAPKLIGGGARRETQYGGQVDILPTLLALLGGDYVHASWGRNLLNLPVGDSGFAVLNVLNRIGYKESRYLYSEDVGGVIGFEVRDTIMVAPSNLDSSDFTGLAYVRERLHRYVQLAEQLSTPAKP